MGIRESLEEQTMNMAKAAAASLIQSNLRLPSGEPVECIISETTIGELLMLPVVQISLKEKVLLFHLLLHHAGVTEQK
jgi:L-fucose isomerase-like protein